MCLRQGIGLVAQLQVGNVVFLGISVFDITDGALDAADVGGDTDAAEDNEVNGDSGKNNDDGKPLMTHVKMLCLTYLVTAKHLRKILFLELRVSLSVTLCFCAENV